MRKYIYLFTIVLFIGCFVACSESNEDIGTVPTDELCTLSIQIGASNSMETRAGDDPNALDHEFIHELCVFIVSDGIIEKKLMTNDGSATPNDDALDTGDAYEWRSEEFTLPSGEKTIYAFANWSTTTEGQTDGAWKAIIDKAEGATLSDTDLNITLNDPASQVALAGTDMKFIPMSVKQPLNLSVSQTARIELVRLVGRVNVKITNNKVSDLTVTSFSMSNFADKVALMPEGTATEVTYTNSYQSPENWTLAVNGGSNQSFSFYVNETENNTPFNIGLTADGNNYSATTTTQNIPRNNILPLDLRISENDLSLVVTAYIAPIGGYPVQVYTSSDLTEADTYNIMVPEGCSFHVEGSVDGLTTGSCELDYSGTTTPSNIQIDDTDKSWAHVTSLEGLKSPSNITPLKVSYVVDGATKAECTLYVSTEKLKDLDEYTATTRSMGWLATPLWYEPIQLTIQQGGKE